MGRLQGAIAVLEPGPDFRVTMWEGTYADDSRRILILDFPSPHAILPTVCGLSLARRIPLLNSWVQAFEGRLSCLNARVPDFDLPKRSYMLLRRASSASSRSCCCYPVRCCFRERARPNVVGQWTTTHIHADQPCARCHVTYGEVLIVSGSGNVAGNTNFQAGVFDPSIGVVTTQPISGHVLLRYGDSAGWAALVVGGAIQYDPFHEEPRVAAYDPATNNFTELRSVAVGRWYPTAAVMGDGRVMAFSGLDVNGGTTRWCNSLRQGQGGFSGECAVDAATLSADELIAEWESVLLGAGSQFCDVRSHHADLDTELRKDEIWRVARIWKFGAAAVDTGEQLFAPRNDSGRGQSFDSADRNY